MEIELKSSALGLCPTCMAKIPARVVQRGSGVFLQKRCARHGMTEAQLERDADLYQRLRFDPDREIAKDLAAVIVTVTHRCNIHCRFCYLPDEAPDDPTREEVLAICEPIDVLVLLGGREPTLRHDLPELISDLKARGKAVGLITNGIRLANLAYVEELKQAGLDMVILSLSSLRDSFYAEFEGHSHLARKLEALDNLAKVKLESSISATITASVNDDELAALWQLCLDYREVVTGFRVRTSAEIGRSIEAPDLFLSDILDKVADAMGVSRSNLLANYDRQRCYHSALIYRGDAHLSVQDGVARLDHVDGAPAWWQVGAAEPPDPTDHPVISLFVSSWPDHHSIDLTEPCTVGHYIQEGEVLPFFEASVRNGHGVTL